MIIRLAEEQIQFLVDEAKKRRPIEACGILFGDVRGGEAVVRRIVPVNNVLESSSYFQVSPEDFLRALSEVECEGMELIGFFHSHPTDSGPSPTDARGMRLWPDCIWAIISSLDFSVEAYQTVADRPCRIDIEIDGRC